MLGPNKKRSGPDALLRPTSCGGNDSACLAATPKAISTPLNTTGASDTNQRASNSLIRCALRLDNAASCCSLSIAILFKGFSSFDGQFLENSATGNPGQRGLGDDAREGTI